MGKFDMKQVSEADLMRLKAQAAKAAREREGLSPMVKAMGARQLAMLREMIIAIERL
jgi:hypothetical protein